MSSRNKFKKEKNMIDTTAIRTVNNDVFSIIWDTGRKCNYDCTYCEATRHNNFSKHKSLEEFKETFEFIREWATTYNSTRKENPGVMINFTGGEPTANPVFWDLVDYIRQEEPNYNLSLTTNGAWGPVFSSRIVENFNGVTISYHAEAHENLKELVLENIETMRQSGIRLQVNVMLHVDYWDETVNVYKMLKEKGVAAKPRPIGDGNIVRKGWFVDTDGTNRRTSHEYTSEQQAWFFNEVGVDKKPDQSAEGNQIGRSCCGGRCLEGKVSGEWKPITLVNTNFNNWYCMVDRFFLYIDQETKDVYHHQTCKALYDKKTGAIGSLNNTQLMLDNLRDRLQKDITIICPNNRCGCGMCVPKAKTLEDFNDIKQSILAST